MDARRSFEEWKRKEVFDPWSEMYILKTKPGPKNFTELLKTLKRAKYEVELLYLVNLDEWEGSNIPFDINDPDNAFLKNSISYLESLEKRANLYF